MRSECSTIKLLISIIKFEYTIRMGKDEDYYEISIKYKARDKVNNVSKRWQALIYDYIS